MRTAACYSRGYDVGIVFEISCKTERNSTRREQYEESHDCRLVKKSDKIEDCSVGEKKLEGRRNAARVCACMCCDIWNVENFFLERNALYLSGDYSLYGSIAGMGIGNF